MKGIIHNMGFEVDKLIDLGSEMPLTTWCELVNRIIKYNDSLIPTKNTLVPEVDHIVYDDTATIVHWTDKTKTVVRTNGTFDKDAGFAFAYIKKAFGSRNQYMKLVDKATVKSGKKEKEFKKTMNKLCAEYDESFHEYLAGVSLCGCEKMDSTKAKCNELYPNICFSDYYAKWRRKK